MLREKIEVYLALGSNLGDRFANLDAAQSGIASAKGLYLDRSSPTYESPAADLPDQPRFLNRVLDVQVWLTPRELLETCQGLEVKLGRESGIPKGPRIIDIDILLYGYETVNEPDLVIPHPALARRAFFLQPLKDIVGDMILPGAGVPLSRLLAALAPYELVPYKPTN
jgi:2-amino-4-hydroxy-6-hydroxymethyldihydropteridine diphosphokinase